MLQQLCMIHSSTLSSFPFKLGLFWLAAALKRKIWTSASCAHCQSCVPEISTLIHSHSEDVTENKENILGSCHVYKQHIQVANGQPGVWIGQNFRHLVGTGTSVRAPSITACCRRTNATKGVSRKSTSPTSTLEASASLGNFFMNLFFSWKAQKRKATGVERCSVHTSKPSRSTHSKLKNLYQTRQSHSG